jgi:hypothetical protein
MKYTNQALFKIFKMNCCPLENNLHYLTMQLPAHFKTGEPLSFKPNVSSIKLKISRKVLDMLLTKIIGKQHYIRRERGLFI